MADEAHTRQWLVTLGRLTTARLTTDEAADFVAVVAPALASRFTDAALTFASAEAVAANCKHLPSYGEIVPLLRHWWRENRPQPPALPPPPIRVRGEPSDDEREHASRTVEDVVAWLRSNAQPPDEYRNKPASRHLSRAELNEAYRRAGVKGPAVNA
jgi:hypothetical protein